MADIDMTDAPSGSGSAPVKKALGKAKAASGEGGSDGKKRFEVKKVGHLCLRALQQEV
jgi:E3 ubiquitin-protein ligase RBX1